MIVMEDIIIKLNDNILVFHEQTDNEIELLFNQNEKFIVAGSNLYIDLCSNVRIGNFSFDNNGYNLKIDKICHSIISNINDDSDIYNYITVYSENDIVIMISFTDKCKIQYLDSTGNLLIDKKL